MKKILLVLFAATLSLSVFAQTESTHLKFKGIPIDGDYKVFAQQLVRKGFQQIDVSQDGIILKGNFMATAGVLVAVYPNPSTKIVSYVAAMIETGDSWAQVESKYYDVVDTYKEKYGEPTEHIEEFTTEVYDSNIWRLNCLHDGQCNYKTIWEIDGGRIVITPTYYNFTNYIICGYVDELNEKALHQTIIDDI